MGAEPGSGEGVDRPEWPQPDGAMGSGLAGGAVGGEGEPVLEESPGGPGETPGSITPGQGPTGHLCSPPQIGRAHV